MNGPTISVVIPSYKRVDLLKRCLQALETQSVPPESFEILVVDDVRCEDSRRFVQESARLHRDGPTLRYMRPAEGTRGPAAARNAGWYAARGEIIAFTDDDTVPARDWLAEGRHALRPGIAAAWGRVVVPLPEKPTDWERDTKGLDDAGFVTANCFVRWAALA